MGSSPILLSPLSQQRLLTETWGAGVEERSAGLADGEFGRRASTLALMVCMENLLIFLNAMLKTVAAPGTSHVFYHSKRFSRSSSILNTYG
jgi:hypothetical protein